MCIRFSLDTFPTLQTFRYSPHFSSSQSAHRILSLFDPTPPNNNSLPNGCAQAGHWTEISVLTHAFRGYFSVRRYGKNFWWLLMRNSHACRLFGGTLERLVISCSSLAKRLITKVASHDIPSRSQRTRVNARNVSG